MAIGISFRRVAAAMALAALAATMPLQFDARAEDSGVLDSAEDALKDLSRLLDTLAKALPEGQKVVASSLADAINTAHERAKPDARPMPSELATDLKPFFATTPWIFERVRWVMLDEVGGLTDLVMLNPDVNAITLKDIIVFRDKAQAEADRVLWAHELVHVLQYETLGVDGFAKEYLETGGADFEKEADEFSLHVKEKLEIAQPKLIQSNIEVGRRG
jgi:hypothetical protein